MVACADAAARREGVQRGYDERTEGAEDSERCGGVRAVT
jgi:hypothetical protein